MLEELRDINYKQKYRASSQLKDAAEKASDERDKSALTIIGGALSLGYNHSECNYRPLIRPTDGRRSYAMEDIDSGAIDVLKEAVDVSLQLGCGRHYQILYGFKHLTTAMQNML